jgi:signal transduction histidine kinase
MAAFWKFINEKWFSTIRRKLAVVITLLVGGVSFFIFIYFPAKLEEQAIQAIAAKAKTVAEMTAFSVAPALFFEDTQSIREALEGTKQNKDLVYVAILDNSRSIVASIDIDKRRLSASQLAKTTRGVSVDGMIYHTALPIWLNDRQIGNLYLGLSLSDLKTQVARSRETVASISSLIFIFGVIAAYGISILLTRPLSHMVEKVGQISEGDLSQRAIVSSQDEVGHLAHSFNIMVDNLESAHNQLEQANQDLKNRAKELQREVDERKRAEQRRIQVLKELENTNQELKDFAYIVSHDLKAPLRAISSLATWLIADYSDKLDEEGREQMDLLMGRVNRMHRLIEAILQYSRVGRIREEKEWVDLDKLVAEVIDLLVPPENIKIKVQDKLPSLFFERTRIQQVFQNLLSNAVKYMDKPQGEVRINCIEVGDCWTFRVSDNGPGIEERYYDKIFQIFQTLSPRDESERTGVGLTIVKKIVEMYGGRVWVESRIGQGSTFLFTVPKPGISPPKQKELEDEYEKQEAYSTG